MNRYKAFEVTIFKSFTVVDGETLLKASERCLGHIIKVGCRGGGCGVCKVKVVKGDYETGKMSLKVCSLKERKNNIVLACRCYPKSENFFVAVKKMGDL